MKMREPDEKPDDQPEDPSAAIESCARDLIKAVHAQDIKSVAEAIQSAFTILDSQPHEEYDHESDNSFKMQNAKAAKQQENE